MNNTLIKICGLQSPDQAIQAIDAGADYIGLVFHPLSKRFVSTSMAKNISAVTLDKGAIPVGIFVDQSYEKIMEICDMTQITIVQLYGHAATQHVALPTHYRRWYVQTLSSKGVMMPCDETRSACDPSRDALVFDHHNPGHGHTFDWNQIHYEGDFPIVFAGGLTSHNVGLAIQQFRPSVVDVSSGVEQAKGIKDLYKMQQFVHAVRSAT